MTSHELRWFFFGIRGDGGMANWVLTYNVTNRTFNASNTGSIQLVGRSRKAAFDATGSADAGPVTDPFMFIKGDDTLTQEGKVTDILRNRLKPEDIAKATAASIASRN